MVLLFIFDFTANCLSLWTALCVGVCVCECEFVCMCSWVCVLASQSTRRRGSQRERERWKMSTSKNSVPGPFLEINDICKTTFRWKEQMGGGGGEKKCQESWKIIKVFRIINFNLMNFIDKWLQLKKILEVNYIYIDLVLKIFNKLLLFLSIVLLNINKW